MPVRTLAVEVLASPAFTASHIAKGYWVKMVAKNNDLHGNVPDECPAALLIIDVINDLEFEGGDKLLTPALSAAEKIADLKRRARQAHIPAIYVNDNFGRWQSDFRRQVAHCLEDGVRGEPVVRLLVPEEEDYFVLKPKHSGFYSTALDILLVHLNARTLILTGLTADNCILFTAHDAYLRDFQLFIPSDCVASIDPEENRQALRQMQRVLNADIRPSVELNFEALK
ncbi:MAG TPA: isochorismatase family cysteine hydrolase [Blastocatellia bacterium]